MRALAYVRSAASEATIDEISTERQRRDIAAAVESRGWELAGIVEDTASAAQRGPHRPTLRDAVLRVVDGEADVLVVSALHRVGSGAADLLYLRGLLKADRHFVALTPALDTTTREGRAAAAVLIEIARTDLSWVTALPVMAWRSRTRDLARLIPPGSVVLDVGAGAGALRNHLPPGCTYRPADLVDALPGVAHIDAELGHWPTFEAPADVVVAAGVLEYVTEPERVIGRLLEWGDRVLVSHEFRGPDDKGSPWLRAGVWASQMTTERFEAVVEQRQAAWRDLGAWGEQRLYELRPERLPDEATRRRRAAEVLAEPDRVARQGTSGVLDARDGARLTVRANEWDVRVVEETWVDRVYDGPLELPPAPTVVDVGAYIGDFTVHAAHRLGARVIAYEPVAENFELLERNVALNDLGERIVAVNEAVGPDGDLSLNVQVDGADVHASATWYDGSEPRIVPSVELGTLLARHELDHVDLLKIDCEGMEYDIVETASDDTLGRIGAIALEFHRVPYFRTRYARLKTRLRAAGFALEAEGRILRARRPIEP